MVVAYVVVGRHKHRLDHTVIMLGVAMFVFNVSSTFCDIDFDGSTGSNFRYAFIEFSFLAANTWIIMYCVFILQAQHNPDGAWSPMRYNAIGWGVPLACVGMMFGINPNPQSKGGYACWSHGIDGKNKEMWIVEVVVISITLLTIMVTVVRLSKLRSKHDTDSEAGADGADDDSDDDLETRPLVLKGKAPPLQPPPPFSRRTQQCCCPP